MIRNLRDVGPFIIFRINQFLFRVPSCSFVGNPVPYFPKIPKLFNTASAAFTSPFS